MKYSSQGTAVVTGASSGLGRVYADRLARRGYDLLLVARSAGKLVEVSNRIASETGRDVDVLVANLNDKDDVRRVEARLRSDQTITMLVNNAGVGAVATLLESNVDAMEQMIELNVTALTRLTYAAAPQFVARERGAIINIASAVAIAPEILNGVYGATKAFVLALSLSLHKELAGRKVQVQAVLPGAIATPFWSAAGGALEQLPGGIVMTADDLVDAALSGFDRRELVTIPSLPEVADWDSYERARQRLIPNLSLNRPAARYGNTAAA